MTWPRSATVAAAVALVVTVLYLAQLARSERRAVGALRTAEERLGALRGTGPVMAAQAESLVGAQDLMGAARLLENVVQLVPEEVGYGRRQGDVWQTLGRWAAAEAAYRRVLALAPGDPHARTNLALTTQLSQLSGETQTATQHGALVEQSRFAEAMFIAARIHDGQRTWVRTWSQKLTRAGLFNFHNGVNSFTNGELAIQLINPGFAQLEALQGVPVRRLYVYDATNINHLAMLRGMALKSLTLTWSQVTSLEPLRGMPLRALNVKRTPVTDLSPIAGLRLEYFQGGQGKFSDLGPLHGMPLKTMFLDRGAFDDVSPLAGLPLEYLNLHRCQRPMDLRPLAACRQLKQFFPPLYATDWTALRGLPPGVRVFTNDHPNFRKFSVDVETFLRLQGAPP